MTKQSQQQDARGYDEVVVARKSNGKPDFKKGLESQAPLVTDQTIVGWGSDLKLPAWKKVRENLQPEHYEIGEHVATIHYDLDSYEYDVEYHVELKMLKRVRLEYGQRIFETILILSGIVVLILMWEMYNIYAVAFILLLSIAATVANHSIKNI